MQSPEHVAGVIEGLLDRLRNHVSARVGALNPLIITGFRFLLFVYDRIVGRLFRLLALTRRPTAPTSGNVATPVPDLERVQGRWPASSAPSAPSAPQNG